MKFLMTMFQIQDYGGIINHAEYLAKGLKELGHEVDFTMLVPKDKVASRSSPPKNFDQYRKVGTGYHHHQARGWVGLPKVPYLSKYHRDLFKQKCSKYDAILWHIPVPTLSKENNGVTEWLDLYDHGSKNIAIVHDGNLPELYPHLIKVHHEFHAAVCVHESAMRSGEMLPIPRKLIVNPFDVSNADGWTDFNQREGFAAIQVFKAWKRVDTLVRAIAYMQNNEQKLIGGEGIEYRYMTSQDKCKPKYFDDVGERIWERAKRYGMEHLGTVPNDIALEHLKKVKLQIDPSYSKKYSSYGAHFNRTTVEAILCGAVPMATDWGMKDSEIFIAGKNYIEIPAECKPFIFADLVDNAVHDKEQWLSIKENNLKLIQRFDMRNVAQEYVDLVKSTIDLPLGVPDALAIKRCNKNLDFFGLASVEAARGV